MMIVQILTSSCRTKILRYHRRLSCNLSLIALKSIRLLVKMFNEFTFTLLWSFSMKGNRTGITNFSEEYFLGSSTKGVLNTGSNVVEIRLRRTLNSNSRNQPSYSGLAIGWMSYDHPVFHNQSIPNTN